MKAIVFFISNKAKPGRRAFKLPNGARVWLRAVEVEGDFGLDEAMNVATHDEDETLMNSHPCPDVPVPIPDELVEV